MLANLANQQRRVALGSWRLADRAAQTDKPWTDRNVRLYQGYAVRAETARREIIRKYLRQRSQR